MGRIEESSHAVADELYEAYVDLLRPIHTDSGPEWCYKRYACSLDGRQCSEITLRESTQLLSRGTTGLSTWEASFCLSEFVLWKTSEFAHKTVVELGAGLGLAGIVAGLVAGADHVTLTDFDPTVLECLAFNVSLNVDCGVHGHSAYDTDLNPTSLNVDAVGTTGKPRSISDVASECNRPPPTVAERTLSRLCVKELD
eukprot:Opistho-2@601